MQLALPMLTYYDGPRLLTPEELVGTSTFRAAVLLCWEKRTRKHLTQRLLAMEAELYASHVSDYLSEDHAKRELPAKHVAKFEEACGNRAISQWLAGRANLTILETFIARRAA